MFNVKPNIKFTGFIALVITMLLFSISQDVWATANDNITVKVVSTGTFDHTVDKVKTLVAKNGMMVMGEINQGKMLSMTGLKLNAVSLVEEAL